MSNSFAFNASTESQATPEQEALQEQFLLWLDEQPAVHFGSLPGSLPAFLLQTGLTLPDALQSTVSQDPAFEVFCHQALTFRVAHLSLTHQALHHTSELSDESIDHILSMADELHADESTADEPDSRLVQLSALYDSALSPREAFQAHAILEADTSAKQTYQVWQTLSDAFESATQTVTASMPDFSQNALVQAAIEQTVRECIPQKAKFSLSLSSRRWSAMAAAISLVLVSGGLFWRFSSPSLLSQEAIPSSESFLFANNSLMAPLSENNDGVGFSSEAFAASTL